MTKSKTGGSKSRPTRKSQSDKSLNANKKTSKPSVKRTGTDSTDSSGPRPKK